MPELTSKHLVETIDHDLSMQVQAIEVSPNLAILSDNIEHAPSLQYVGLKQRIARRLGITSTALFTNNTDELEQITIDRSADAGCHAIIVQLPLADSIRTDGIISQIAPHKDVDGLVTDAEFTPATPLGILTLIEGHSIDYRDTQVVLIGKGRLVGAPLLRLMRERGAEHIFAFDETSSPEEVRQELNNAKLIISAVGKPELLTVDMFDVLDSSKTFIDAGAAESGGVVVGDVSAELREAVLKSGGRITAQKGSVGPLTVRALLSNVVSAAAKQQNVL